MIHPKFEVMFSFLEFLAIFVIIFSCFFVYFRTKEIYDLTSHKGIGYFRKAFLFFGVSSTLFLCFVLINYYFNDFRGSFRLIMLINFMGFLYLLFSLFYKRLKYEWIIYIFTLVMFLSSFLIRSRFVLASIVLFLILVIGVVSVRNYFVKKKSNINSNIYFIYSLLFCLFIFNVLYVFFDFNYFFGREIITLLVAFVFGYICWIVFDKLSIKGD